ncbi:MAG: STAS/SEC14 domain-containing protein [Pyrinomonadaceae bacterium]
MTSNRHGLSIGMEKIGNRFFLTIKVIGKLTHKDYGQITPLIDAALESVKDPKINVLFDASEMHGWELRAAWDDFKLGLRHGSEFSKVAVFGHEKWEAWAVKIGSWFFSGEIRYFEDLDQALEWIREEKSLKAAKT